MRGVIRDVRCIALILLFAGGVPLAAQQTSQSAVTVQATGTFSNNGSFAGTLTINRFEQRNGGIVAIGAVQGTLIRANRVLGTALTTQVAWPVSISGSGGQFVPNALTVPPRISDGYRPAGALSTVRLLRTQSQGCTPLQVNLSANNVDLLGVQVAVDPVGLTLNGAAGTPLGDLVCAAADLVGNVAGLVTLLNNLLAVLTGSLGAVMGAAA